MKHVYFIGAKDAIGAIKIGCSKEPSRRIKQILIWSPVELELLATAEGGHREEGILHQMFGGERIQGEWFKPTKQLLSIIAYVKKTGTLPPLDYRLDAYDRRKKDPTARSKMPRRKSKVNWRFKRDITVSVARAERRVYGYAGHEFMRPSEIEEIISGYQGYDAEMPGDRQLALIREYIAKLDELPSLDRRYDNWLDWHRAMQGIAA